MTVGRCWIRRPRPPTRSGPGRAAWPESPASSRRTTRRFGRSCSSGPGFAQEVSGLLNQIKPTLPILLANLTTLGQILVTYNPSLEQLLVIFPIVVGPAGIRPWEEQSHRPAHSDFALTISRSAAVHGRLPAAVAMALTRGHDPIDTPDGLYCKLPQDSPIWVRGARNYPCMGHPGKRAPTVELCNDPKGFNRWRSASTRSGRTPFDPNLISQGVPVDDRVDFQERIYAPLQGTPLPPGAVPSGTPPGVASAVCADHASAGGSATAAAGTGATALPPPPPPGTPCNGTPIPPAEPAPAWRRPPGAARRRRAGCAKCVQRQRFRRPVGRRRCRMTRGPDST